ncbi:hypothetical protein GCM10027580_20860 [Corynebacterium faecale]
MVFHDETTAQRVMNLSFALHTLQPVLSKETRKAVDAIIKRDLVLLSTPEFYAGVNNHGMFQNMAILFALSYGHCETQSRALEDFALARLAAYFVSCYTADGIHNENNPYYHMAISRHVRSVLDYAESLGKGNFFGSLRSVFDHADEYAAFSLTPGGHFPPISDTLVRPISKRDAIRTFGNGWLLGAVTGGDEGRLPTKKVFVAESSGYGICRTGWTGELDTYVFFHAAYNSDYHKHSDELSLYIYANGHELITESGTHGYERDHPFTKYAHSSFSHNTLLVDGAGLPRTDRQKAHLTSLSDTGSSEDCLDVTGRTLRFEGVDWTRRVQASSDSKLGRPIIVQDRILSEKEHSYTILWHFGSELVSQVVGSTVELRLRDSGVKVCEMGLSGAEVLSIEKYRGETQPSVQGWKFPKPGEAVEADCLQFEFSGVSVEIDWTISLTGFSE